MKPSTIVSGLLSACLLALAPRATVFAQSLPEPAFDPRESLLAALGKATLDCLGTVGPSLYETSSGVLARTFRACTTGDERALAHIDALLGVQASAKGRTERVPEFFVQRWNELTASFPHHRFRECPDWTLLDVIDAPTWESVPRIVRAGRVGKENARYRVASASCRGQSVCAVTAAAACAEGFGSRFIVEVDHQRARIEVDPAWWLLDIEFDKDEDNPFLSDGYFHGMSYYGGIPGAQYAAVERAGEACSTYDYVSGKHRTDGILIPIDCGDGWECMSYCVWVPTPTPAQPPER